MLGNAVEIGGRWLHSGVKFFFFASQVQEQH